MWLGARLVMKIDLKLNFPVWRVVFPKTDGRYTPSNVQYEQFLGLRLNAVLMVNVADVTIK